MLILVYCAFSILCIVSAQVLDLFIYLSYRIAVVYNRETFWDLSLMSVQGYWLVQRWGMTTKKVLSLVVTCLTSAGRSPERKEDCNWQAGEWKGSESIYRKFKMVALSYKAINCLIHVIRKISWFHMKVSDGGLAQGAPDFIGQVGGSQG